jgi:glutaredoxin
VDTEQPRVTLVGRAGCHLCDDAREVVRRVTGQLGVGWTEVSVDDDGTLLRRYGEEVPVVLVDGVRHAYWRVDAERLREALAPRGERRRRWPRRDGGLPGTP